MSSYYCNSRRPKGTVPPSQIVTERPDQFQVVPTNQTGVQHIMQWQEHGTEHGHHKSSYYPIEQSAADDEIIGQHKTHFRPELLPPTSIFGSQVSETYNTYATAANIRESNRLHFEEPYIQQQPESSRQHYQHQPPQLQVLHPHEALHGFQQQQLETSRQHFQLQPHQQQAYEQQQQHQLMLQNDMYSNPGAGPYQQYDSRDAQNLLQPPAPGASSLRVGNSGLYAQRLPIAQNKRDSYGRPSHTSHLQPSPTGASLSPVILGPPVISDLALQRQRFFPAISGQHQLLTHTTGITAASPEPQRPMRRQADAEHQQRGHIQQAQMGIMSNNEFRNPSHRHEPDLGRNVSTITSQPAGYTPSGDMEYCHSRHAGRSVHSTIVQTEAGLFSDAATASHPLGDSSAKYGPGFGTGGNVASTWEQSVGMFGSGKAHNFNRAGHQSLLSFTAGGLGAAELPVRKSTVNSHWCTTHDSMYR